MTNPTALCRMQLSERQRMNNVAKRPEVREKIRAAHLGKKLGPMSRAWRQKISKSQKFIPRPQTSGAKNGSWRGGVTRLNAALRHSIAYERWKIAVMKRDDYTCQYCQKRGGYLHAHHIHRFATLVQQHISKSPKVSLGDLFYVLQGYKKLWDIKNGITLCEKCHKGIVHAKS